MRNVKVFILCLTTLLIASLIPATILGMEVPSENIPRVNSDDSGPWWMHWWRDADHNGIDDLIEEKMVAGSNERIPIYVKYVRPLAPTDEECLEDFDLEIGYVFEFINTISARNVELGDIPRIRSLPGVGFLELQTPVRSTLDISTPAVKARNSTEYTPHTAWGIGYTGKGVNIAIIDSGVDDNHESLMGKFVAGVTFDNQVTPKDGTFNPNDEVGHGTYCAGIALGTGGFTDYDLDGEADYMGVAPDAKLIDVQYGQGVIGMNDPVTRSIEWVVEYKDHDWPNQPEEYDGIDIISLSLDIEGTPGEAAAQAVSEGLIVVTSAGNDGPNNPPPSETAWPGEVIVVGSINDQATITRDDDVIALTSSRGPRADGALKPDICAPGDFITAPAHNSFSGYGLPRGVQASGTSFAAPHVAGVVALTLEAVPNLTPEQVMDILHESSEARGEPYYPQQSDKYNNSYGWGIVDAYEAVKEAQKYDETPPEIDLISHDVSGNTVTINWHTNEAANSIVEYGKTENQVLDQKKENLDDYTHDHTMVIKGLEQSTNYSYKIKGSDEQGNMGESAIRYFDTPSMPDTTPPEIFNVDVSPLYTSATIMWKTDEKAYSVVEYGETEELGLSEKNEGEFDEEHSVTLIDLIPDTTYYFRVVSTDGSNNTNKSITATFTTDDEPTEPPEMVGEPGAVSVTDSSATIEWKTNKPTNSVLSYGTDTSYAIDDIPEPDGQYYIDHSISITGLSSSTEY
ncbi:MAG: S8 family serine peptidase, partial [Thermoplasmata archaeon]